MYSGRRDGAPCQIRELSDTGARIRVSHAATLPEDLYLIIARDQVVYESRVVWRSLDEAGLKLIRIIDLVATPDLQTLRFKQLLARQSGSFLSWR